MGSYLGITCNRLYRKSRKFFPYSECRQKKNTNTRLKLPLKGILHSEKIIFSRRKTPLYETEMEQSRTGSGIAKENSKFNCGFQKQTKLLRSKIIPNKSKTAEVDPPIYLSWWEQKQHESTFSYFTGGTKNVSHLSYMHIFSYSMWIGNTSTMFVYFVW